MGNLPTGTVTFLFTDLEGSTRLAQQYPDSAAGLLERHHAILKSAIEAHGGYVFHIVGDAFCAAFQTVREALDAALEAQRCLAEENWSPATLRVRMGISTGTAQVKMQGDRPPDYSGYLSLARAERVMSVAYGGQILLASASAELLREELPQGVALRDMGEHRLKSLLNPEHVWQVVAPGLQQDFPALASLNAIPNNLPLQLTSFVGREREMAEVARLLESHRLVTLTGSGGTGKSRLALQMAAEVLDQFHDGVWFAEVAQVVEPNLLPQAMLHALKLAESPGRHPLEVLKDYLSDKSLLIILDNCEHLLDACCRLVGTILQAAPSVKIVPTSRETLNLLGEQAYRVPSFSVPDVDRLPPLEELIRFDAVRLFADRAALVVPDFALTEGNASAVVQICRHLDGIPLALELAAARVKSMPLQSILSHLDDRFRLLTGGSRTALPRHQTLRAMIDWSYALLSGPEKLLIQRLSIFRGGRTMEAAEVVCSGEGIDTPDVLDLMSRLVDKSLLSLDKDGRYRMLETLREYASDEFAESPEDERAVKARHCGYYTRFLQERATRLVGRDQKQAMSELIAEDENVQVAWDWAVDLRQAEEIGRCLESFAELHRIRGLFQRGEAAIGRAAEMLSAEAETDTRPSSQLIFGRALVWQARFLVSLGRDAEAQPYFQKSMTILRELGARREAAYAIAFAAGSAESYGKASPDESLSLEALAQFREMGDPRGIALATTGLAWAKLHQGNYVLAKEHFQESLDLFRKVDNREGIIKALSGLGYVSWILGEPARARELHEEMLALCRETGDQEVISLCIGQLGIDAFGLKCYEEARRLFQESLELYEQTGDRRGMADELGDLAEANNMLGEYTEAVQCAQRSRELSRQLYYEDHSWELRNLAKAMCALGDLPGAREHIRKALLMNVANHRMPFVLLDLVVLAQLMKADGRPERALELLAHVLANPISWQMAKDQAAPLIASVEPLVPPVVAASARARGRALDLETTIREVLDDLHE